MKKLICLFLLVASCANAQVVNIPDVNFKASLFAMGYDANDDNEIDFTEAAAIVSISPGDVSDLTGIEAFTNLNFILISAAPSLTGDLDLSVLSNLTSVRITNTGLTSLDLSGNAGITTLQVNNNQLVSLDVTGLSALTDLECYANNLTSLDITTLTSLFQIDFGTNQVTSIDFSNCPLMQFIFCNLNPLEILDLSNNPNVAQVDATLDENLTQVFIKNGHHESQVFLNGDSGLQFVCCDESDIAGILSEIQGSGIQAVVNSYCSFAPGGNYNTIAGAVRFDADGNGCDIGDFAPPFIRIGIDNGINSGATFTNHGNYSFYTQAGNFTLTPQIENPSYFSFSPSTAAVSFASVGDSVTTQDFCITANGVHPDVEVVIAPLSVARPGFDAIYKVVYRNKGNQTLSGAVALTFDDSYIDFVSANPAPETIIANNVTFVYFSLLPFENRQNLITFHVHSPLESQPVNSGDILHFNATAAMPGDEMQTDNAFALSQTVVNAIDPNTKQCLEGTAMPTSEIGNYLHYNINFENAGTADAINVVVKDTIDTAKFDINSLQVLNASAPVNIKVKENVVEFIFENINLPPSAVNPIGGHGNVLFKVKTLPTLTSGDIVMNTANIYFDYNPPIDTNEARTTFTQLANQQFAADSSISVYPNPANDKVRISAKTELKSVEVYDAAGRILEHLDKTGKSAEIDLSAKTKGVYFLKISTLAGASVEKIIKQ